MKKKVSFVITSLVRSGAERVTVLLAENCLRLGYDVEIIMLLYPDVEFELSEGIKVIDFSGTTKSRIKRIPYWIKSLKRHFKERKPDVVVSFIGRINVLTCLSLKKNQTNLILSERNDPRHDSRTFITRRLINKLYPKANHIVFQTEEAKNLFKKKIRDKGVVIPNPINITKYADLINYDKNLITFAGRYSEQKNVETIINSAEIVKDKHPNVRFELYGTGPLKESLQKMVDDKHLTDNVFVNDNVPDIVDRMRNSALFVMSSLYEGMSNSLLEASYSGVPCLTTKVLGSDVIKEGENGFFFGFKNYQQLANIIDRLMTNKEEYNRLRDNSIKIAKSIKHLSVFDEWMSLFEE